MTVKISMKKSFVTVTPDEGFGNKALSINCDVYSDANDQKEDIIVSSVGIETINLVTNSIW